MDAGVPGHKTWARIDQHARCPILEGTPLAGGLVALLDDVSVIARAAAASVDDVGAAAAKAGAKATGVVIDDAAVTPQYVRGLASERELPIVKRIALGSLRNKFLIILPAILLLSQFVRSEEHTSELQVTPISRLPSSA